MYERKFGLNNQLLHAYKIKFVKTFGVLDYLQDKEISCLEPELFRKIEKLYSRYLLLELSLLYNYLYMQEE